MSSGQRSPETSPDNILVVDDHAPMRESLVLLLEAAGFNPLEADGGRTALRHLEERPVEGVLADLKMEDMSGLELLKEIRKRDRSLPVILITAYGTIESAVEAMRIGAVDYLTKPYDQEELLEKLRSNIVASADSLFPFDQDQEVATSEGFHFQSQGMRKIWSRMTQAAKTDLGILITGETGTGKTLLAREIHNQSPRANGPFININCAGLPEALLESELFGHVRGSFTGASADKEGLFEAAHGGTIFLDEVGSMPEALQAKLLGVLQDSAIRRVGSNRERKVDIRVVAATGEEGYAGDGRPMSLREDLYYRLNGVRFHLPPLRDRPEDIRWLAEHFLREYAEKYGKPLRGFDEDALEALRAFPFPGNVRQLQAVMEQVTAFAEAAIPRVTVADLPEEVTEGTALVSEPAEAVGAGGPGGEGVETLEDQEIATIKRALEQTGHNLTRTARNLGIGRTTLWRKMKRYGLE
ncbi:hypothetical protein AN478_05975 [Thiohalorhabdus denitrificans]|uniref:Two-component system, NtrC family, response regulator AtoC n=1 Tax=Thiohalorhabdus denitrificans TaxID=381306 RepID=A0A0P9C6G0_9GAMM|nr:sigma-54 dependent transcriptional regulator [Thiohalorhabdus denitrificans]KPV40702.1 hypothetical protein AN478_05975 [Thiohalorhabdus denitrificans]SCY46556.1 two-component system, NtrC family, response regulator AtoC [Thiohalorhabdus denitrificans]